MNNFVLKISFTVNLLQLYLQAFFITIGMISQKFLGLYRCVLSAQHIYQVGGNSDTILKF